MNFLKGTTILSLVCILTSACEDEKSNDSNVTLNQPIFEKIDTEFSGIQFQNTIQENIETKENLFNYDYFYNGAGVGIIDFNNDGLQDIFFCGNQVENKLYKNLGDFKFEDVSNAANINTNKNWSNGVSIVDINNDGWQDIYVSQGGPYQREKRSNLLYINQKNGTFLEQAEEFGLADQGISTQTVFFDFDNDNDLDCFVMNENEFYGVDPINLFKLVAESEEAKYFNSCHFYENDNGKFKDITKEAGLERPFFGLGITVTDINNDNLLDFYVASDYYIPDALFINNGNGTFSDQIKSYTQQISYYGMGMDVADINNDGLQDIFVLDMAADDHVRSKTLMASMNTARFDYLTNKAGFHYQYMYNSLQLNLGNNTFSNVVQQSHLANTDWSWSVLMADYDLDSDKDIFVTNGYRRYALDNDLQQEVYKAKVKYKGNVPLSIKRRLYESMPSEKLPNILFENNGGLNFEDKAKDWGLADFSFSNGAAIADFDNDGDLDAVVNNMDEVAFLYKNTAADNKKGNFLIVDAKSKLSEAYPKIEIFYDGTTSQMVESRTVRGYRSSHQNIAHFGLGNISKVDSVYISWPNGKHHISYDVDVNKKLVVNQSDANNLSVPDYRTPALFKGIDPEEIGLGHSHKENIYDDFEKEILLPYKQSTQGPFIEKADVNNDGYIDILLGGASDQPTTLFVQSQQGKFTEKKTPVFLNDKIYEDTAALFIDIENDGDLDLFIVSGGNEFLEHSSLYTDRLYLNDGKGNFTRNQQEALNSFPKSGKTIASLDFNQDGYLDIIVGNRIKPQNYPRFSPSIVYQNNAGTLKDVTSEIIPDLENFGMVNDILITDFNGDDKEDLIAVGEWTNIGFFKNEGGTFSLLEDYTFDNEKGWWYTVKETDVNNDGMPDYLVGNVGQNLKFHASKEKPFKIYANDFDDNGTPDIVLSKKYKGEFVPVRGRECSSQQMPFIKEKFETFDEFANAKLVDVYGEKLDTAYENEVTNFNSILLLNKGNGDFVLKELPTEAQSFPVLATVFKDLNGDGFEDCILAGNIYQTEVETPRLDFVSGVVLISNQKDGYKTMNRSESGLYLTGNAKDLVWLKSAINKELLLTATNNSSLIINSLNN
ncbi:RNA-binding protein [Flagellimonas lutimaris]|uniref:RNA-binding protein n=1 Tax=Flagellimonas lutimaris TaxID=475082 RepID=A0A3A1N9I2_9FLAO|nr:VCBS repeat-containing protein [Allomuricauda lutimaris]RIV35758.1 RNA-binding protein [Allomuricauda lutimaris]